MSTETIIQAIDTSPLNRGLKGEDWVLDKRNVAVVEGEDVVLFDYEADGVYQVHFLLKSRGRHAIAQIRKAFRDVFDKHGAQLLFGLAPAFRRDVNLMSRWVGAKFIGERSTEFGPCDLFVAHKDEWQGERT